MVYDAHTRAVNKIYRDYRESLDSSRWDAVYKEQPYLHHKDLGSPEHLHGFHKGEFDVLLVDYDARVAKYVEVKTKPDDVSDGWRQIRRAQNYFEQIGWDIIGSVYLEN